jgi:XTP/dITP diphosphohydrolase
MPASSWRWATPGRWLADLPQHELGLDDVPETGLTFVENALLKAATPPRHRPAGAGRRLGPDRRCPRRRAGLYSARYAGEPSNAAANIAKLLDALRDVRPTPNRALLLGDRAAAPADDPQPLICEGRWEGRMLDAPRGEAASATTRCSST